MKIELRALMLADPKLAALVSGRVDWGERPQADAVPSVVLTAISPGEVYHMRGRSNWCGARVQIDIFAADYGGGNATAEAVRDLLSGYFGGIFQGVFLLASRDLRSAGADDPDRLFGVSQDYQINYFKTE
jgi:hypothetical protein